jgi:voltage-gated potassium channel
VNEPRPARSDAWRRLRRKTYELLDPDIQTFWDRVIHNGLIALILLNVAVAVLESVPALSERWGALFLAIEIISVAVFTAEYLLRLWSTPEHGLWQELTPWQARLKFAVQPQAIIDFLAVAPFYLVLFTDLDLRTLLLLRLFRFFKLARYSPGMASLLDVIYSERRSLLASFVILAGGVLIAASAMYYAEHNAQPDKFGTIPDAMYWAIVTLATVGYGDVVPVTPLGKTIAGLSAVAGIVMLALPVGILASAFAQEIHRRDFVVTWSMVARVPIFAELDADELAQIMRCLSSRSCEEGEIIVHKGEPADSMYFITAGEVEIELPDKPVRLTSGDFFGEIAILPHTERTATVKAATRAKLLVLDAKDLNHLMDHSPRMANQIHTVAKARQDSPERGDLDPDELRHHAS